MSWIRNTGLKRSQETKISKCKLREFIYDQRISFSLFSWQRGCQETVGFCFMTMTSATAAIQNDACANQLSHLTNVRYNDLVSQRRHDKRLNIFKCFVLFL
jgi:hypothetical protein